MLIAQRTLEHKLVAQKLRDYGVTPADAQLRLASMSDQDLHRLASASKGLPSGGDSTGAIIGVLIVVILVIVILKLMNRHGFANNNSRTLFNCFINKIVTISTNTFYSNKQTARLHFT